MSKYRLKVRYSRVEGGVVKKYKPGSEVELSDREVAKLGPAAFDWSPNMPMVDITEEIAHPKPPTVFLSQEMDPIGAPDVFTPIAEVKPVDIPLDVVITPDVVAHVESSKKTSKK